MVDVKNKKCKGVQCKDPDTNEMITKCPFDQRGNPKYKGYYINVLVEIFQPTH